MIKACLFAFVVCLPLPASAALSRSDLDAIALELPPHASVPMQTPFTDRHGAPTSLAAAIDGRATLLVPVDYICPATCGPAASIIASALERTGLRPGKDFTLLFVGLRPNESTVDRESFLDQHIDDAAQKQTARVLSGDEAAITSVMAAIGYRYRKDEETNSFAHPTAAVTVSPDGRVARVLSTVALDPTDLKLALVEASNGQIGGIVTRLRLLCYRFDPAHGIYTSRVTELLRLGGLSTLAVVALAFVVMGVRTKGSGSRT